MLWGEVSGRGRGSGASAGCGAYRPLPRALRRRRRLRASLVQLAYIVALFGLSIALSHIRIGPMVPATTIVPMLFALAGALVSFIAIVYSLLFLVMQWASSAYSPRLHLFRDHPSCGTASAFSPARSPTASRVGSRWVMRPSAPAGFEPALTAPEAVAVYGPDQRKRALARLARARIGRNPRDRTPGTLNGGGAGEHRGASTGFRPAVLLHGMSRRRCRQV